MRRSKKRTLKFLVRPKKVKEEQILIVREITSDTITVSSETVLSPEHLENTKRYYSIEQIDENTVRTLELD